MAKPKLALIPAAQGTSLYSVLPSSGVGRFPTLLVAVRQQE